MKFIIASNNQKKIRELAAILSQHGFEAQSLKEAGIYSEPEETGSSFEDNALIKARAAMKKSGFPAVADDSGLMVEALGGEPGIYSARYCEGSDMDRVHYLLKKLTHVPAQERQAKFVSAIACVFPDGREFTCRGECEGEIAFSCAGENGFGYDPVFYVPDFHKTFAELPEEIKNQISHRAVALHRFAAQLAAQMTAQPAAL